MAVTIIYRTATGATEAAAICSVHVIIAGYAGGGAFDPQGDATRCQMAKIIAVTARIAE